jgi:hypothetical protein
MSKLSAESKRRTSHEKQIDTRTRSFNAHPGSRRKSTPRLSSSQLLSHDRWCFGGKRILFQFPSFVGAINLGLHRLSLFLKQRQSLPNECVAQLPQHLEHFNDRTAGIPQMRRPSQTEEIDMKRTMTFAIATAVFALTLSALPRPAAASSTTSAAPGPTSELVRKAGGDKLKYMEVGLAVDTLLSVLLP